MSRGAAITRDGQMNDGVRPAADVVVVGGGPAGAASAVFLRQLGHAVVLLDKARFPRDKVCGESVSPEGRRLIEAVGAGASLRALAPWPIRGMTLTAPDGTRFSGRYPQDRAGFALRREALDAALLERARAAGVAVREGVRATGVVRSAGRVTGVECCGPEGPELLGARLVVVADGRDSVVARRLGRLRAHPRLRRFAVRAHFEGVQGLSGNGEMHVTGGAYCGIAPLSESQANVAIVVDAREMRKAAGDVGGFFRETLSRSPQVQERLAGARLLAPPRAIGPLALVADRVSVPGAALVGDAAGFFDPFTGEGITLALRSAELLAGAADAALRTGRPELLARYARERHAATRDKFLVNRLIQEFVSRPALANATARRLRRRPDLADRLVGIAGDFVPARSALGPGFVWDLVTA